MLMIATLLMPAGKYYVGDLCYVMHGEWDECCDLFFAGRNDHGCNEGIFTLKDGRKFATFNTAYGDGSYRDQHGREYGVDSGGIGCIRVEDIDFVGKLKWGENDTSGGQVIEFKHDFTVSKQDGVLHFGNVVIDTAGHDNDDYYDRD